MTIPLAVSACGIPHDGRELTDEEREQVLEIAQQEPAHRELVIEFIKQAPKDAAWVDAQGASTTGEKLIEDINIVGKDLAWYVEHDRVFAYSDPGDAVVGQLNYNPLTPEKLEDDYLMLNADKRDHWDVEVLAHEISHRRSGDHDPKFESELREEDPVEPDRAFGEQVQFYTDFAYQNTGLYVGPLMLATHLTNERDQELADKETFADEQAHWLMSQTDFLASYGMDEAQMAKAIHESSWYETEAAVRAELAAEPRLNRGELYKKIR